jgi:hypothetical protein
MECLEEIPSKLGIFQSNWRFEQTSKRHTDFQPNWDILISLAARVAVQAKGEFAPFNFVGMRQAR